MSYSHSIEPANERLCSQNPCMSGWPSGVRAGLYVAAAVCAATGAAPRSTASSVGATFDVNHRVHIRILPGEKPVLLATRIPLLLQILETLVFQDLHVLLRTPVERHAHLPGSREHFRVLDGDFVQQLVRPDACIALHHVQGGAVEISRPVEPCLTVEIGHVDDERVTFPGTA